jgi:hypothetical protein
VGVPGLLTGGILGTDTASQPCCGFIETWQFTLAGDAELIAFLSSTDFTTGPSVI